MNKLQAFENLDRVAQVELRPHGLPQGDVPQLYRLSRGGDLPLSYLGASALLDDGVQRIACLTGIIDSALPYGEIDGPIGSAVLADSLTCLGRTADVLVPEPMLKGLEAIRRSINGTFGVIDEAKAVADEYDAAITVEKLGRNRQGVTHLLFGKPLEPQVHIADDFVERLNETGKLTIGCGDGGNEIGFGSIFDEARRVVKAGAECGCGCGGGVVTGTRTRILFPAAVSNFGCYALVSALGILQGLPLLLPAPMEIKRCMQAAARMGLLDGGSFVAGVVADDGAPLEAVLAVVTIMRSIASQQFQESRRS